MKLKVILTTLILLFSVTLYGSGNKSVPARDTYLPSLDWQKFALEQSISKKVRDSLSTIIKSNEYVVDVEINVSPPSKPKFVQPEPPGGGAGGEEKEGGIKPTDVKPDKLPRDYIVFSKLGLEAPLIDDFKDFKEEKKGGAPKAKAGDELPSFEQLWKFNKALDIFNNLESVKIYVQLSEKLHTETRDAIKKVLNSLKFNLNEVVPELEITYINMEEKYNTLGLPGSFQELVDFLSRFSNMIGLIMATILLGIIAFVLFNKWADVMRETSEAEAAAAAAAQEVPKEEEEEKDMGMGGPGGPFDQENTDADAGIDRFVSFLEHSEIEAVMLVKRWLNTADKKEVNALRALVQQMKNDVLMKIFKTLTVEEREKWKGFLTKQLAGPELIEANAFISNSIVADILVPAAIVDAEVADLLLRLTPENGARFIQDNGDLGKVLLNVMNTKFVAKILEHLDEDMVDGVLSKGMEFKKEDVDPMLDEFKAKLKDYQVETKKLPFMEKILDLIPVAMPSRENSLFKVLATNSEDMEQVKGIAMKFYPSALVPYLPEQFLKSVLQTYPMGPKVELVASLDEHLKDKFVNIFAPAGSKAADVLELEMEKIDTDLGVQRRIKNEKDNIW